MIPVLSVEQLLVIGGVAAALGIVVALLTQGVLIVAGWLKKPINKDATKQVVLVVVAGAVAIAMAFFWTAPIFPAFPAWSGDFFGFLLAALTWIGQSLAIIVAVAELGHVVYKAILKNVVFPATKWVLRL